MTDPELKKEHTTDNGNDICPPAFEPLVCEIREPLVRIAKRGVITTRHRIIVYIVSFFLALVVSGLLLLFIGKNPISVYSNMATGAFGTRTSAAETFRFAIPLLISGIAIAFAFKMKFWNIGGEGQILAGAIFTSYVIMSSIQGGNRIPYIPLQIMMLLMALAGGALFGFIPSFFKTKWGTNETLFTLMLNYIAIQFVKFLQQTKSWQSPRSSYPKIINFKEASSKVPLPKVFGVHIGWIFALVIAVLAYFYLKKTKHGYEISVIGDSLNTARYAGMNTRWIQIRTMIISGALCGLAGYLQVAGADYTLTDTTAGGIGFTAITVAWLAKLNPFVMIPVSIFIAMLKKGSLAIQSTMKVPASAAELLTGIILFFMLGSEFFIEYRLIFRRRAGKADASLEEVSA
jgi:simple sugar transport system permease protein